MPLSCHHNPVWKWEYFVRIIHHYHRSKKFRWEYNDLVWFPLNIDQALQVTAPFLLYVQHMQSIHEDGHRPFSNRF